MHHPQTMEGNRLHALAGDMDTVNTYASWSYLDILGQLSSAALSKDRGEQITHISWGWHMHHCQTTEGYRGDRLHTLAGFSWWHVRCTYHRTPMITYASIPWLPRWWNNCNSGHNLFIIEYFVKLSFRQLSSTVLSKDRDERITYISWQQLTHHPQTMEGNRLHALAGNMDTVHTYASIFWLPRRWNNSSRHNL